MVLFSGDNRQNPRRVRAGKYGTLVAIVLVFAVLVQLWFPSPVAAFDLVISHPSTGLLDSPYNFIITVSIPPSENLGIVNVAASIYKSDDRSRFEVFLGDLPLTSQTKPYIISYYGGYRTGTVTATAHFGSKYIYYSVSLTVPATWPMGKYQIEVRLTTINGVFTRTSDPFILYVTGSPAPARQNDIFNIVEDSGRFIKSTALQSPDGNLNITIARDTIALTDTRVKVTEISIVPVLFPPPPLAGTSIIGDYCYDLGPGRATFSPPIMLTFYYHTSKIPAGFTEQNLVIAYYDMVQNQWIKLGDSVVDTATYSVSAPISHFTPFALMTHKFPASFAASDLSITPAEVTAGESTNVTVTVSNRGNISGSYEVVLMVDDNRYTPTRTVTLDGKASENVTFEVTKTVPGNHRVRVDGLSGTFSVIPPPAAIPPPAPTEPPTRAPKPTPKPVPEPDRPPPPAPIPTPPPPPTVSGWIVLGWFAGFVFIILVIILVIRRIFHRRPVS